MSSEDESIFALREVRRQLEQPWDLEIALARNTPQALLRDLHRPVVKFTITDGDWTRHERPTDCGANALREIRVDACRDLKIPIADLLHTSRTMHEEFRALKADLRKPWTDAPKFGRQTLPDHVARFWFQDH